MMGLRVHDDCCNCAGMLHVDSRRSPVCQIWLAGGDSGV
jgi:hypothetical protein